MPELTEWVDLLSKVAAFVGAAYGIWNSRKIEQVHKLTNSLATRAEALAHSTGLAEGNIEGRKEQTAERNEEKKNR